MIVTLYPLLLPLLLLHPAHLPFSLATCEAGRHSCVTCSELVEEIPGGLLVQNNVNCNKTGVLCVCSSCDAAAPVLMHGACVTSATCTPSPAYTLSSGTDTLSRVRHTYNPV